MNSSRINGFVEKTPHSRLFHLARLDDLADEVGGATVLDEVVKAVVSDVVFS